MNAKSMVLSAVICGASILGVNMTAAFAAPMTYELQAREISEGVETQELSEAVRNRNRIIGAVIGAAAIGAIVNHNKKHSENYHDDDYDDYDRYNRHDHDRYDDRNQRDNSRPRNDFDSRGSSRSGDRNAPPPPPMPSHNHR